MADTQTSERLRFIPLNKESVEEEKQTFRDMVLSYGEELDSHLGKNTPKDVLTPIR